MRVAAFSYFALFLLYTSAHAEEPVLLENNKTAYGYYQADLPFALQIDECDKYIFADKNFSLLKSGKYKTRNGEEIMVDGTCLYTQTGKASLSDGGKVEFFSTNAFDTQGNVVFLPTKAGYKRIKNGKLVLENGQAFSIEDGYISNDGRFENGRIVYDDRN